MEGVVLFDNSVGAEIYWDGIVGFDCFVEVGFYTVGQDDFFIQDCTCGKKDYIYAEVVR